MGNVEGANTMTTNTQNANTNRDMSLRNMLVPALLFYVMMTAMFLGLDAFMDQTTSMNLPFMPFLVSMVCFTSDARRAWDIGERFGLWK